MAERRFDLINQLLSTNGDGTGTTSAVGTYTPGAPGVFYITPAAGQTFHITRIIMSLEDGAGFKAEGFGAEAALTNGWKLEHKRGGSVITDFTSGQPIKTNARFGDFCYDVDVKDWGVSPTNELLLARLTFSRFGQPLILHGDESEQLVATYQDTMTAFIAMEVLAQGYLETLE